MISWSVILGIPLGLIFDLFLSRLNAIDPALRRSGRFDVEIEVTAPTEEERLQILEVGSIAL